jgi:hypothetical protein
MSTLDGEQKTKSEKIEAIIQDWLITSDMQTIFSYASEKLSEGYETLSEKDIDKYYKEAGLDEDD